MTTTRSPLRDNLLGYSFDQDRPWLLHAPDGTVFAITEYNDELTGFSPELQEIDPTIFCYGGNAYYIVGTWAEKNGFRAEKFEDRYALPAPPVPTPPLSRELGPEEGTST